MVLMTDNGIILRTRWKERSLSGPSVQIQFSKRWTKDKDPASDHYGLLLLLPQNTHGLLPLPRSPWDRNPQFRLPFKEIITKPQTTKSWQALSNFLKGGCSFPIHHRQLLSPILTRAHSPFHHQAAVLCPGSPASLHHNNFSCALSMLWNPVP